MNLEVADVENTSIDMRPNEIILGERLCKEEGRPRNNVLHLF